MSVCIWVRQSLSEFYFYREVQSVFLDFAQQKIMYLLIKMQQMRLKSHTYLSVTPIYTNRTRKGETWNCHM